MRRQKSENKAAKVAAAAVAKADADIESSPVGNANTGKKGGRKKLQTTGANSARARKSSGKAPGAKLRSQAEKPSSKRVAANGTAKGSSPTTKTKGAAAKSKAKPGAKPTKTTKKREKDIAKSVGGAREALQQARKLEKNNSKAVMAAEVEKFGMGKKKETKQTKGNAASASFMTLAGRYDRLSCCSTGHNDVHNGLLMVRFLPSLLSP
jgi:hypothetical protein